MYCYEENKFVLFLFVGVLVSCTNTYDVCEMQRNETEDMSSRMAGDGVYDVLGFGYDITEDYLGENSTRLQVIDVKALIRDNGDRFYNPFIGTIDQKLLQVKMPNLFFRMW